MSSPTDEIKDDGAAVSSDFFQGDIRRGLERMRLRLLDLTARNRLLNFRHTKKSSLRVVDELPDELYHALLDGKELQFHHVPRPRGVPRPMEEPDASPSVSPTADGHSSTGTQERKYPTARETAEKLGILVDFELPPPPVRDGQSAARHSDREIQTLHYPEELESILRSLTGAARLAIEETGTNMLYLVAGYMEWYESVDSKQARMAPLLLLPVSLQRLSAESSTHTYRYAIRYSGEDVQANISLQERLRADFGLNLPDLEDGDLPEAYLRRVRSLLKQDERWRIHRNVTLTLLSFGKLLMYRDLNPATWPDAKGPAEHARIKEFFTGIQRESHSYAAEYSLDDPSMIGRVPAIVDDADSSQHSALVDAMDGRNLVIEGPPGTGKSQTITNLIAAALVQGKSVLFVSEKLAALEVVRHRLDKVGLGTFCLELHSHKTQKRMLLEDVGRRIEMRRRFPKPTSIEDKQRILESDRRALTAYAELINRPFGRIGRSLHDIIWSAQRCRSALHFDPVLLEKIVLDGVPDLSLQDLEDLRQTVARYASHLSEVMEFSAEFPGHPWYGVNDPQLTFVDEQRVVGALKTSMDASRALLDLVGQHNQTLGSPWLPLTAAGVQSVVKSIGALPQSPGDITPQLLPRLREPELRRQIRAFAESVRRYWALVREMQDLAGGLPSLDGAAIADVKRLLEQGAALAPGSTLVADLAEAADAIEGAARAIREAAATLDDVHRTLGVDIPLSRDGLVLAEVAIARVRACPLPDLPLRHPGLEHENASALAQSALHEVAPILEQRGRLGNSFDLAMLPERGDLRQHVTSASNARWWSLLVADYRAARRAYNAMIRVPRKTRDTELTRDLRDLLEFTDRRNKFEASAGFRVVGGPHFEGLDTPYHAILAIATWRADSQTALAYAGEAGRRILVTLWAAPTDRLAEVQLAEFPDEKLSSRLRAVSQHMERVSPWFHSDQGWHGTADLEPTAADLDSLAFRLSAVAAALRSLGVPDGLRIDLAPRFLQLLSELNGVSAQINGAREVADALGHEYRGTATDLDKIGRTMAYYRSVDAARLPIALVEWLLSSRAAEHLNLTHLAARDLEHSCAAALATCSAFFTIVKADYSTWNATSENPSELPLLEMIARGERAMEAIPHLPGWLDYLRARNEVKQRGLELLVGIAERAQVGPADVTPAFESIAAQSLVYEGFRAHSELARFSGLSHEHIRKRFATIDRELMVLTRVHVASVTDQRPVPMGIGSGLVSSFTELHLLEREIEKQKRHIPIRQLVRRAGHALQALKPCFMMGPLSVAQYLPPGQMQFDLVVMDEASQLRPEDALGAIARAKQVVVVGDRMQLPPTSFFDRIGDEEADVTSDDALSAQGLTDSESILDVASAVYKPARLLRWHYRSRHASLIAFSNKEFYENKLIAFPSPLAKSSELGVKLVHVRDGVYESRSNVSEATRLVATALRHMRQRPDESLGVVTLNAIQRDLVESMMEQRLKSDPVAQHYVDSRAESLEPFFIKNLENVQGDERDVIYISVTYGPSPTGHVFQRFGPINGPTGHRRLNVLFTRARRRVVMFSSLLPEHIHAGPDSSWGAKALKGYLKFAITGQLEHATLSGREPDSEFEIEVAHALRARGLETVAQVGVSGYFVDLAVVHPQHPDSFLLGIECDGRTYHSSVTARDRDRLRQSILEDLGWTIHRVWSTDWFKASGREVDRVVAKVEHLLRQEKLRLSPVGDVADDSAPESTYALQLAVDESVHTQWLGEVESQPATVEQLREALVQLRGEIGRDLPSGDPETDLLRAQMVEALLRERPRSKDEWLARIPFDLRMETDGPQLQAYLSRVLALTSRLA